MCAAAAALSALYPRFSSMRLTLWKSRIVVFISANIPVSPVR